MELSFQEALYRGAEGASTIAGNDPEVSFKPWAVTMAEKPLARIVCIDAAQVASALRVAGEYNVPVTVCGGREDVWGRNSRRDAVVIDLSQMKRINYAADRQVVTIESGVTTGMLLDSLPAETVIPTTVDRNVGLIGAAMGGGYGLLCGRYGLTCDAMLSAEIVTTSGEALHVNESENVDLLYGLRGGGSGYGVVMSASFKAYDCGMVLAANVVLPIDSAVEGLLLTQQLLDEHPLQLGILPLFKKDAAGRAALVLSAVWNGPERAGRDALQALGAIPNATVQGGARVPFRSTLDDGAMWPWGKSWAMTTSNISRLTREMSEALLECSSIMPARGFMFLHDFHGQALQEPQGGSAFPFRINHFVLCAAASYVDEDSSGKLQIWAAEVATRIKPMALKGGYINFLSPSQPERVDEVFGAQATSLRNLKQKYDSADVLRYATGRLS